MGFYSFAAYSPGEVWLPEQRLVLDRGINAFNVLLDDVEAFKTLLQEHGVSVQQVNRLDEHEPVAPQPEAFSGDVPIALTTGAGGS